VTGARWRQRRPAESVPSPGLLAPVARNGYLSGPRAGFRSRQQQAGGAV